MCDINDNGVEEEWEDDVEWSNKAEMDDLIAKSKQCKQWPKSQTAPEPTVPVSVLFPNRNFPEGQICDYTTSRRNDKEAQSREEEFEKELVDARKAAEVHRQARQWTRSWVKPGMNLQYICESMENKVRELLQSDGLEGGLAFPTGCSINEIIAHYTPNPGEERVLQENDVLKLDLGVHVNGRIIDSAFTMCFNPVFQPLLDAVRDSTEAGVRIAGVDVRICEIGEAVQEVMESSEIEIGGTTSSIKCVSDLCGHNICQYKIHGNKRVPIIKNNVKEKMEEGEFFAIETFGSTGPGYCMDMDGCSHFMRNYEAPPKVDPSVLNRSDLKVIDVIQRNFGTLAFCPRYVERIDSNLKYQKTINKLVHLGLLNDYPPLTDVDGSFTSQFEHTIAIRPTCKEVLSRGDDY
ncbi:methionine aminopeptidase [Acrasis kona]|uniref:Methionine aminopeptidase 2 n=1 Tax=Acrasis kona TaxID=1008807 RepID=A0AAW2YU61_9EUKA